MLLTAVSKAGDEESPGPLPPIPLTAASATLVSLSRPGLVHFQRSSAKFEPVDGVDRGLALRIVCHLDKPKAPGSAGIVWVWASSTICSRFSNARKCQ